MFQTCSVVVLHAVNMAGKVTLKAILHNGSIVSGATCLSGVQNSSLNPLLVDMLEHSSRLSHHLRHSLELVSFSNSSRAGREVVVLPWFILIFIAGAEVVEQHLLMEHRTYATRQRRHKPYPICWAPPSG